MSCCKGSPSRRSFLAAGGVATTILTFSGCASEPEQELFTGGELTRAVELAQLPPGDSVQLAVGAHQVLIHRESNDTIHAFSAVCTHQGCIVGVNNDVNAPFVCPCHSSTFDKVTGEAVAGPAQLPLTRHNTVIEHGWVLVEVEPV